MKLTTWLQQLRVPKGKIKTPFLDIEFEFRDADRRAAWAMYIELITRITVNKMDDNQGDNKAALDSIFKVFGLTRDILKAAGPESIQFAKLATYIINSILRPFTAKWHPISLRDDFTYPGIRAEFRQELAELQNDLIVYVKMLAQIIEIEDISDFGDPLPKA